jgi:hypothetical protein
MTQTAAAPAAVDRFGVPLKGWSLASLYPYPDEGEGTLVTVACDQCGEGFVTDSPDDDTTCAVCLMPPAEVAALRAIVPAPLRHGAAHMRAIGKAGAQTTIRTHGVGYWRGLVQAKGWHGRRPVSLATDLAVGYVDAALAA